jgi:hypothetical protein
MPSGSRTRNAEKRPTEPLALARAPVLKPLEHREGAWLQGRAVTRVFPAHFFSPASAPTGDLLRRRGEGDAPSRPSANEGVRAQAVTRVSRLCSCLSSSVSV